MRAFSRRCADVRSIHSTQSQMAASAVVVMMIISKCSILSLVSRWRGLLSVDGEEPCGSLTFGGVPPPDGILSI